MLFRVILLSILSLSPLSAAYAGQCDGDQAAPNDSPAETTEDRVTLQHVFGDTAAERLFETSFAPYLAASSTGGVSMLTPAEGSHEESARVYHLGKDLLVTSPQTAREEMVVTLPDGYWVNFLTGAQSTGSLPFTLDDLPPGTLPVWARGGSVIERTLRHSAWQGNPDSTAAASAHGCETSCLFDVMPPNSLDHPETTVDAYGRSITRSGNTLVLSGVAAGVTVRWRFVPVIDVRLNGKPIPVQISPAGTVVSFQHQDQSRLEWTVKPELPRSY